MTADPRDLAEVRKLLAKRKTVSMSALRILGGLLRSENADAVVAELESSGELVRKSNDEFRVVKVEPAEEGLFS